jgi:uncharacterized tellurite resistance protein B-like protein
MIKSFSRDEKKALVAILKFIVNADGLISEGEIAKFNEIAEKKGFEDFTNLFEEVDREIHTMADLKKMISLVINETHKNDILKYALEISVADATINPKESQILKSIGKAWNVDIQSILNG